MPTEIEQCYRHLFENAPVGMIQSTLDGNSFIAVNDKLAESIGAAREELLSTRPVDLYADPAEHLRIVEILKKKGYISNHELVLKTLDGGTKTFLVSFRLVREIGVIEGSVADITERKAMEEKLQKAQDNLEQRVRERTSELYAANEELQTEIRERQRVEEELRESERKYRSIFENSQVGIFRTRASDGLVLDCNDRFANMFGFEDRKEMMDARFVVSTEHADAIFGKKFGEMLRNQKIEGYEARMLRRDGTPVTLLFSLRHFSGHGYLEGVVIDVTDRRRAEVQMENLLLELDRKNKELESVVYAASHDLRSPLINIQGFSATLKGEWEKMVKVLGGLEMPDDVRAGIQKAVENEINPAFSFINASIHKMDSLINGLLRLSRAGRVQLHMVPLDMNRMLGDIRASMNFQAREAGAGIEVGPLPGCTGDVAQLNQVFSNLLNNAINYRDPARPLEVKVSGRVDGEKARYSVSDNGRGIPSDKLDRIWGIFVRLDPEGPVAGEGLGLALCKRIVERHGGKIWAESEEGLGSTFHVELPLK